MNRADAIDDFEPDWHSFSSFFTSRADQDSVFLVELDHERATRQQWNVREWQLLVRDTAAALAERGVANGQTVPALLGNRAEALATAFACWVLGACYVPLNPHDSQERQRYILRDSGAQLVVHGPETASTNLPHDECEPILFDHLLANSGRRSLAAAAGVTLDADALRVYTSGTTGEPNGVILTARNLLIDCAALARATGWNARTRVLTVLPVHHVNGLVIGSLLPWFLNASTVLCDRFRSEHFWDDAAAEGATASSLVPSLLEFLLLADGTPGAAFEEVLCGAGPLLSETALAFENRFAVPVRHLFGMSETTAVVTLMPRLTTAERHAWHRDHGFPSIGPAVPHANVAVLDKDGRQVGSNERGELAVRGGMVMRRYANEELASSDEWLMTGDEGFWVPSAEGLPFFFITGRIKEMIIRGGVNISPLEIDAVINQHEAVAFGLALPFANRFYGDEVAAYVVRTDDVSADELIEHCAQHLDFARCPKVVIFGDEVPFTATGKPKRIELARRLSDQLAPYRDTQFRRSRFKDPNRPAQHPSTRHLFDRSNDEYTKGAIGE
jgi:long-chain acyl-CoA synthetase